MKNKSIRKKDFQGIFKNHILPSISRASNQCKKKKQPVTFLFYLLSMIAKYTTKIKIYHLLNENIKINPKKGFPIGSRNTHIPSIPRDKKKKVGIQSEKLSD